MNYFINDLMDECFKRFNETYSCLLDTEDYVPTPFTNKRRKFIFRQERKAWRKLKREVKKS